MTKSAKCALAEGGVYSGESSTSQHLFVGYLLLPPNFKNTKVLVEGVNFLFLQISQGSRFAAVQWSTGYIYLINIRFCADL